MLYGLESNLSFMNSYGERLEQALKLAGRERQELADGIKVSVQAIGQVISGKSKALNAENTALAARFLGVDFFWLATGIGSPAPSQIFGKTTWPFSTPLEELLLLPEEEQKQIDKFLAFTLADWHSRSGTVKSQKAG